MKKIQNLSQKLINFIYFFIYKFYYFEKNIINKFIIFYNFFKKYFIILNNLTKII